MRPHNGNADPTAMGHPALYSRVILIDLKLRPGRPRIFHVNITHAGLEDSFLRLPLTTSQRMKTRELKIYDPPSFHMVLAKAEEACTSKEMRETGNFMLKQIEAAIKKGFSVEEAAVKFIQAFPAHVRHGILYQRRGLPESRTLSRLDRSQIMPTASSEPEEGRATDDPFEDAVPNEWHEKKSQMDSTNAKNKLTYEPPFPYKGKGKKKRPLSQPTRVLPKPKRVAMSQDNARKADDPKCSTPNNEGPSPWPIKKVILIISLQ